MVSGDFLFPQGVSSLLRGICHHHCIGRLGQEGGCQCNPLVHVLLGYQVVPVFVPGGNYHECLHDIH